MSQTISQDGWVRDESTGSMWRYNPSNDTIMLQSGRSMPRPSHISREQCLRTLANSSSRYTSGQAGYSTDPRSTRAPSSTAESTAPTSLLANARDSRTYTIRAPSDDSSGESEADDADDADIQAHGTNRPLQNNGNNRPQVAGQYGPRIIPREAISGSAVVAHNGNVFNLRESLNQRHVDVTGFSYIQTLVSRGYDRRQIEASVLPVLRNRFGMTRETADTKLQLWYNSCTEATVRKSTESDDDDEEEDDDKELLDNMTIQLSQATKMPPETIERKASLALCTAQIALSHPEGRASRFLARLDTGADFNAVSLTTLKFLKVDQRLLTHLPRAVKLGDGSESQVTYGLYLNWREAEGEEFRDWFYVLPRSLHAVVLGSSTCQQRGLLSRGGTPSQSGASSRSMPSTPLQYGPLQFGSQTPSESQKQQEDFAQSEKNNVNTGADRFNDKVNRYRNSQNPSGYSGSSRAPGRTS